MNLEKIINEKLKKNNYSKDIISKIKDELKFIKKEHKEQIFLDLILIKDILDDLCYGNYAIYGIVSNYYISELLGICKFNEDKIYNSFEVNINIPEDVIKSLVDLLRKELKCEVNIIKKNSSAYGITIKNTKNDIITIYEKVTYTILNRIYKYNDMDYSWDKDSIKLLKKSILGRKYKQLTAFEFLMQINHFNYQELKSKYKNMADFDKEEELTWYKYFYPRIYYYETIKYAADLIFDLTLKSISEFYKDGIKNKFDELVSDAKKLNIDFTLEENDNYKPKLKNLVFIESRMGNGMPYTISKIINNSIKCKENLYLYAYDGDEIWYTSQIIGNYLGVSRTSISKFLNPFNRSKFYNTGEINDDDVLKSLNYFRKSNVVIYEGSKYANKDEISHIKGTCGMGANTVIIDSLDILLERCETSIENLLYELNSMNKRVIIFERPKNKYKINKKITSKDIKYFNIKSKYSNLFYSIYKDGDEIMFSNLLYNESEVVKL